MGDGWTCETTASSSNTELLGVVSRRDKCCVSEFPENEDQVPRCLLSVKCRPYPRCLLIGCGQPEKSKGLEGGIQEAVRLEIVIMSRYLSMYLRASVSSA